MNPPVSSPTSGKGTEPDPFESFVRAHSLDGIDRTLLAALLEDALNPKSECGVSLEQLYAAFGSFELSTLVLIGDHLETTGALRSLDLVEWFTDRQTFRNYYRLARWAIDMLKGVAPSDVAPAEALLFHEFDEAMRNLGRYVAGEHDHVIAWHAAFPTGSGWSRTRFLAREARRTVDRLRRFGTSCFARAFIPTFTPQLEGHFAVATFGMPYVWTDSRFYGRFVAAYASAPTSWQEITRKDSVRK